MTQVVPTVLGLVNQMGVLSAHRENLDLVLGHIEIRDTCKTVHVRGEKITSVPPGSHIVRVLCWGCGGSGAIVFERNFAVALENAFDAIGRHHVWHVPTNEPKFFLTVLDPTQESGYIRWTVNPAG